MRPIIGIMCDTVGSNEQVTHQISDTHIAALRAVLDASILLIPSPEGSPDHRPLLDLFDGFLIPGVDTSNKPEAYLANTAPGDGEEIDPSGGHADMLSTHHRRDERLALVRSIIDTGKPFLATGRGLLDVNIAMGGSLFPNLPDVDGRFNHQADPGDTLDKQHALAHSVTLNKEGVLAQLTGEHEFMVNSLHGRAVKTVAPSLRVEAVADDDTIEALSIDDAGDDTGRFGLAVQWHPEWQSTDYAPYHALFKGFAEAIKQSNQKS